MSLVGIVEGTGGRVLRNSSGVLGGSMLGLTFLHASTKLELVAGVATSVEKRRVAEARDRKVDVARRNMVEVGLDRSGSQVGEKMEREEMSKRA